MEKNKKTKHRGLRIFAIVMGLIMIAVIVLCFVYIDNKNMQFENFEIRSDTVGKDAIKIVHLSDLHFPKIKVNIDELMERLAGENPDIIAITGDLIDSSAIVETCGVVAFVKKIKEIAPVFYVYGNHEGRNDENRRLLTNVLKDNGITILNNQSVNILVDDTNITIIGLGDDADYDKKILDTNPNAKTNYKILLAHRPEKWDNYTSQDKEFAPNLILTGHAHGGQIRFFGQGLVAPNQGLFPTYDNGIYTSTDKNCNMVVSRGIGNSIIPFRFNNKPHIPIITINP